MRKCEYKERAKRKELVCNDALCSNGNREPLYAYPLYSDIKPGEIIQDISPDRYYKAPVEPGLYELWHYCVGAEHSGFEFRRLK